MVIETSVVGSFPKFDGLLNEAIEKAVKLQLDCGIDVITDGEQREGMISYFEQLSGLEKVDDSLRIIGKVDPIKDDLDSFYKIVDYKKTKAILKDLSHEDIKIKITFTGPITLGTICTLTDIQSAEKNYDLVNRRELYFDFSYALLPLVIRALELGALVQIDEPLLSTGNVENGIIKEVLQDFFEELTDFTSKDRVSLHVCGSIKAVSGLFDIMLNLPVTILSMGFSGEKESENINIISKQGLEAHQKKLGVGLISNIKIENKKTVVNRYNKIKGIVGKENIKYLHPDCGFALAQIDEVNQILRIMKIVANQVS